MTHPPVSTPSAQRRRVLPISVGAINAAARITRRLSPPLHRTLRIHKRSHAWPFDAFIRWIESGAPEQPQPELQPALDRIAHLRRALRGTRRATSIRNGVQTADASLVCERVSSPARGLAVLHQLARLAQPAWTVELGSAFGVSTIALALPLRDNPIARFDGVELEPWRAEIADEGARAILADRARVHAGDIERVLPEIAMHRGAGIDLAFIDAQHTYDATMRYHQLMKRFASPGAIVIYDDVAWSAGMKRFWREALADPAITDALELGRRWGITRYHAP